MQEVDERVRYLRLLEPSRLGALCKDFLDDEVLAEMIVAVQAHLAANDVRILFAASAPAPCKRAR